MLKFEKLLESHFTGSDDHFYGHYGQHVLFGDELFDREDPKFPYMSMDEYDTGAHELSSHKADSIFSDSLYIGGKLNDGRLVKIRTKSKYKPGYIDVVIYTDKPDEQVYTFMLARKSKIYKYRRQVVDDLPENKQ